MNDKRSDYDFLDVSRPIYARGTTVHVAGRAVELNSVPDAFAADETPRGVGRAEIIGRVAEDTGLSREQAGAVVNAMIDCIQDELRAGHEISFSGFGKFHVAERASRRGRNPQTGESMTIAASKVPRFTAGKGLRAASAAAPTRGRSGKR
jgi:DNA-binding protein HU-beta